VLPQQQDLALQIPLCLELLKDFELAKIRRGPRN
jgi:hypothetical protein